MSTKNIPYFTAKQIVAMHDLLIEEYGGSFGIRDENAIEAACARSCSGYYNGRIAEAAALMESLLQNHPFVDGNKRIAFASAQSFLEANGYAITSDSQTIENRIIGLFEEQKVNHKNLVSLLEEITS